MSDQLRRRPLEPRYAWRVWLEQRRAVLAALQAQPERQLQLPTPPAHDRGGEPLAR